jgi:hemoglobin
MYETVNENSIADMVDTLDAAIWRDPLLGPMFPGAIGDEWTSHLTKMKAFWSSVLLPVAAISWRICPRRNRQVATSVARLFVQ